MKKYIILIIFINVFVISGFSQTAAISRMEVYMQVNQNDTTNLFGDTLFQSYTKLTGTMLITLTDTTGIASVNVKVGSTAGAVDLFHKLFTYDLTGDFSDGTDYRRHVFVIHLGLGNFTGVNTFYSSADLIDSSGNIISSKSYNIIN
jgi:hypothetical protein